VNKLFTPIKIDQLIDGDCVKLEMSRLKDQRVSKIEHAYYLNNKFLSVIDRKEIETKDYYLNISLHNYKFIAKEDSWYIEGSEVYPK